MKEKKILVSQMRNSHVLNSQFLSSFVNSFKRVYVYSAAIVVLQAVHCNLEYKTVICFHKGHVGGNLCVLAFLKDLYFGLTFYS